MTRKILLVNVNQCSMPYPVFPLGIAYLASACKAAGYDVRMSDLLAEQDAVFSHIVEYKPDYIGLSLRNIDDICAENNTFFAPALYETARKIRTICNAVIILGGSGYSLFPKELLELSDADFGISGEAETALLELLDCLENKRDYKSIGGLVYKKNGTIFSNQKTVNKVVASYTPYWQKNIVDYYINNGTMVNIQTQRGCPFTCCYCTYPLIEGANVRFRDPEVICNDFAAAIQQGAPYVFIVDSVFNTSEEHVTEICEALIHRNLSVHWGCYMRPRHITESLLKIMVRAGLTHIEFGSDSFCDSVLEMYGKKFSFADILDASSCARKLNVHYCHFLILGGPGESEETIMESYTHSKRIEKSVFFPFTGMRIYPGTPLYTYAVNEGYISRDADLLRPCFYISPRISQQRITDLVASFYKESKNWINNEMTIKSQTSLNALRKPGITGPLWEYLIR